MADSLSWTKPRGQLPRAVTPNLFWTGGCSKSTYQGHQVHGSFSCYLVKGSEKTVLVDTGHPMHWHKLQKDVEEFLDGRPLDYVFATHTEMPHSGLIAHWLEKYPNAVAVGDLRDFDMYYPAVADRRRNVAIGDHLDLGDRKLIFVPAIWRDIRNSLWAYDTGDRVLFVADGCSYLHYHLSGACDHLTSEHEPPDLQLIRFFNERALHWTNYVDTSVTFPEIDELLEDLNVRMVATAHGGIIDTLDEIMPLIKKSMLLGAMEAPPPTPKTAGA